MHPDEAAIGSRRKIIELEPLGQDFVRTGRAKGLRPRTVIVAHALRNAMSGRCT